MQFSVGMLIAKLLYVWEWLASVTSRSLQPLHGIFSQLSDAAAFKGFVRTAIFYYFMRRVEKLHYLVDDK